MLESDSDYDEEHEKKYWEEKFFHLRKTQEQLEDCAVEMDERTRENLKKT